LMEGQKDIGDGRLAGRQAGRQASWLGDVKVRAVVTGMRQRGVGVRGGFQRQWGEQANCVGTVP